MILKTLFTLSLMSLCWWRKNIIMMLLNMEMILTISFISLSSKNFVYTTFNPMFMLIVMVIGSSIGISLMVAISRLQNSVNSSMIWSLTFGKNLFNNNNYSYNS